MNTEIVRPFSPHLDSILGKRFGVLDHGFVSVEDYMGNESAIPEAARLSYGTGTTKKSNDEGLIRYLMRHHHTSPFEMCEIKLYVKLPVFVARQWIRHRTASVNEYSARYSILDKEFYMPKPEHLAAQSTVNNQGRGNVLTGNEAQRVLQWLKDDALNAYDHYEQMLSQEDGQQGLARELARMNLPVNFYTQWVWKTDLHNLLHFLRLRMDKHAQYEIRAYADVIGNDIVSGWVPTVWDAFKTYRQNSISVDTKMKKALQTILEDGVVYNEEIGVSIGEMKEIHPKLMDLTGLRLELKTFVVNEETRVVISREVGE